MKRLLTAAVLMTATFALGQNTSSLNIYFADVEGGQATLFVAPSGESLLVDTGWPDSDGRDADRIVELCKLAGVKKIDNVLITHFHTDHVGGVPQLVARIPVGRFIDHGPNREENDADTVTGWKAYQQVLAEGHSEHLSAKPGDTLPITGMHVQVVSADGNVLAKPLPGAGAANSACATSEVKPPEGTENDRSLGTLITFGKLRILDLGDLTWAKERPLVCPANKLGQVDIYIVSHHGFNHSGSPAFLNAIAPRVAIMDNGATKGGDPGPWDTIEHSPRIKDLWQLHTATHSDAAHNVSDARIANLAGPDSGHYLQLTAQRNGTFSLTNARTGETVDYPAN
jgi:competence protein ComEC